MASALRLRWRRNNLVYGYTSSSPTGYTMSRDTIRDTSAATVSERGIHGLASYLTFSTVFNRGNPMAEFISDVRIGEHGVSIAISTHPRKKNVK